MASTMKKEHTFNFPVEQVYEVVTSSIIEQQKARGTTKNLSYTQPIGTEFEYTYERMGQKLTARFKIDGFENNKLFAYKLSAGSLDSLTTWEFSKIDAKTTKVIYTEEATSSNKWTNAQFSFFGWMKKRAFNKQAKAYFAAIENAIVHKYYNDETTTEEK